MASPIIKPAVQLDLLARRRMMAWMAWIEGNGDDLYCWTGAHSIEWDGQTWLGLGHLVSISSQL